MSNSGIRKFPLVSRSGANTWRQVLGPVVWIVAIVSFSTIGGDYYAGVGASVGIMALLALGMILVTGYAGQFSLAVGAFYGIGAYGSALLTANFGLPGLIAVVASAVLAAGLAYALGRPIFRLRGHFLAMGTLALTEVFYLLVNNLEVTGSSSGLPVSPLSMFGFEQTDSTQHFILNWLVVGAVLWGCLRLSKGREGRALKAIRGHEAAAAAAGVNVASSKSRIFTASAVISSIGGSLYAHQIMYVNPPPFGAGTAIDVLIIAVLGGIRTPWGAIIGAIALEFLNQAIEAILPGLMGSAAVGAGQALVLGTILIVILVLRPDGIAGLAGAAIRAIRKPQADVRETGEPHLHDGEELTSMTALRLAENEAQPSTLHPVGKIVLEAKNLVKNFGGVKAVSNVSLQIRAGEILAVIGPNGAGKSTLVNLLSGNLRATSGSIELDGENVTGKPAYAIAGHGLSRTFQTPCLFEGMDVNSTVKVGAHLRGNIGMLRSALLTPGAIKEERRLEEEATAVLDRVGLQQLRGLNAKDLSLGQQKKIEIARALASCPAVLLLDEPCAGLNKAEKLSLMKLLREIRREGIAILVIEHDMEFVMASADRVQVLNFGSTLRTGSPAEVQSDQAVIDAYLGVTHEEETVPTLEEKKVAIQP